LVHTIYYLIRKLLKSKYNEPQSIDNMSGWLYAVVGIFTNHTSMTICPPYAVVGVFTNHTSITAFFHFFDFVGVRESICSLKRWVLPSRRWIHLFQKHNLQPSFSP
jgi:hypothetical protein